MSEIQKFYSGSTVFLTGVTGFLGKVLLEKVLRSCADVRRVYVLIRVKKGREIGERFKDVFDCEAFSLLKEQQPNFLDKVVLLSGDCSLPNLGLCDEDVDLVVNEVDSVLHCAATVRFDQVLRVAAYINVRALIDLIAMAKRMKNLKTFVYVSTAYSHCYRHDIDEAFHEEPMSGKELMSVVDTLTDLELNNVTKGIIGKFPNSYSFTKAVAEDVIRTEAVGLPIAIVRPSIVIASKSEPVPGWVDNYYGPVGMSIAGAYGVLRVLLVDGNCRMDLMPVDYVVNNILAAGFRAKDALNDVSRYQPGPKIYNAVSCNESPITWDGYRILLEQHGRPIVTSQMVYHYLLRFTKHPFLFWTLHYLMHMIPAYLADGIAHCLGKPKQCVKGYEKLALSVNAMSYFFLREWQFNNKGNRALWSGLSAEDKELFPFSMRRFDWDRYMKDYVRGVRVYVMKDPMETVPKAQRKAHWLALLHYAIVSVLSYGLYCFVRMLFT